MNIALFNKNMSTPVFSGSTSEELEGAAALHEAIAAAIRVHMNGGQEHRCKKRHMLERTKQLLRQYGFTVTTTQAGVTTIEWLREQVNGQRNP